MESPRKFNDCYFYYYSTCTKGDNCVFRHEPSALGCETMCTAWQQGKCLDKKCRLRHMELRKNRKQIPCYWENQPGGCRKKHCPFMHKNPDARTDGIAPSQPGPPIPAQPAASLPDQMPAEQPPMNAVPPAAVTGVAQVPLLWQQQRQVVLDSAILGVLPASSDLLGARRVLPPHDAPPPNPYAPMPVDPLVVNFEEESDNESAPSSTPTKNISPDSAPPGEDTPGSKNQELLLLEKIQAEAAAYYSYEDQPKQQPKENRKIVRTNLSTKYDRVSLDELTGKKNPDKKSLDFKVLSLDEIRARKNGSDSIIKPTPITVTLNKKRKRSSQETIIDSGNKIIKLVRSNSVVYKKVELEAPNTSRQARVEQKVSDGEVSRKRTISELSDTLEIQDDELEDCIQFKRVKMLDQSVKPKLIRNTSFNSDNRVGSEPKQAIVDVSNKTDDSDSEVQILGEVNDIIDLDDTKLTDNDVVELSGDSSSDLELELINNVPDVVASCHTKISGKQNAEKDVLDEISLLLHGDL